MRERTAWCDLTGAHSNFPVRRATGKSPRCIFLKIGSHSRTFVNSPGSIPLLADRTALGVIVTNAFR